MWRCLNFAGTCSVRGYPRKAQPGSRWSRSEGHLPSGNTKTSPVHEHSESKVPRVSTQYESASGSGFSRFVWQIGALSESIGGGSQCSRLVAFVAHSSPVKRQGGLGILGDNSSSFSIANAPAPLTTRTGDHTKLQGSKSYLPRAVECC